MAAVKKVKVKLLVNTAYQGPRKEGDVFDVPEDFARRWVKNGIAQYVEGNEGQVEDVPVQVDTEVPVADTVDDEETEVETPEVDDEEVEETSEANYSEMSAKELYALCKERGLEVEPKKGKEYYIEKLTQ